jgi:hypothetical protein
MSKKKPAEETTPSIVVANAGAWKHIGGSQSDAWNEVLANQTGRTLWLKYSDDETRDRQYDATIAGLIGMGPRDELALGDRLDNDQDPK